ncbi:hypothetical protein ZEAMMB73_Zm00001d038853 [Zea mays]|uniref:Uncharacterized protein n=1 Tax=Zea mays TaxID=4577 RepID=A0A1D6MBB3_MAIZE|nr:hypothetical protein ZEAMMB73_Zm00001d038853 [Zea mays]
MADLLHARFLSLPLAPNPSPALPASGARRVPPVPVPRQAPPRRRPSGARCSRSSAP